MLSGIIPLAIPGDPRSVIEDVKFDHLPPRKSFKLPLLGHEPINPAINSSMRWRHKGLGSTARGPTATARAAFNQEKTADAMLLGDQVRS
jgi:hypothetical protein